jgi:hypothetical protein
MKATDDFGVRFAMFGGRFPSPSILRQVRAREGPWEFAMVVARKKERGHRFYKAKASSEHEVATDITS